MYVEDNRVDGEREGIVGISKSSSEEISVLSVEAVGSAKRETSLSKGSNLMNCSAGKR